MGHSAAVICLPLTREVDSPKGEIWESFLSPGLAQVLDSPLVRECQKQLRAEMKKPRQMSVGAFDEAISR